MLNKLMLCYIMLSIYSIFFIYNIINKSQILSAIYVANNTNMANALERCSGSRSPLASCKYAIAVLHDKSNVYIMHNYVATNDSMIC